MLLAFNPSSTPLSYNPSLTEYCASRALPTVADSQYLLHIGAELHPDIDIMWTGEVNTLVALQS